MYSSGRNEEIVGKAIKKFGIPREKLVILAKCYGTVPEEPGIFNWPFEPEMAKSKDYVNQGGMSLVPFSVSAPQYHLSRPANPEVTESHTKSLNTGLSRTAIFNAVNATLARLNTPYIDLLQLHRHDPTVPPLETMRALHDLVLSGKIRYIGASSMWTYQFARLQYTAEHHGLTKFISMQNRYNLCYREEEREMNRFCAEEGVGLTPWGPLNGGFLAKPADVESVRSEINKVLSGGYTEADLAINKRVQEVARKRGWKMSQVALAWMRGKGCVPIVGLTSADVGRLEEACAVRGMCLGEEEMRYLEEVYVPKEVGGHV